MSIETTALTIEGQPHEKVTVVYRGNRDDDPPPAIWIGDLGPQGRVTIDVPQAYIVLLGESEDKPLQLFDTKPRSLTVRLGP